MQADEGDDVALDVVAVREQLRGRDPERVAETHRMGLALRRRGVVDRRDVDLTLAVEVAPEDVRKHIFEAGRAEEIGPQLELQIVALTEPLTLLPAPR